MTNLNNPFYAVVLIDEILQRIIASPPGFLPLGHDSIENHIKPTPSNRALDDCERRKSREHDGRGSSALLYGLVQAESLFQEHWIISDIIAANDTHGQLIYNPENSMEGVRDPRRVIFQRSQILLHILHELRETCDTDQNQLRRILKKNRTFGQVFRFEHPRNSTLEVSPRG